MSGLKKSDLWGKTKEAAADVDPEVAELLRAAEDDVVLKLGAGAHTAAAEDASFLNPDLARRFQALKSLPPISAPTAKPSTSSGRGESPVSVDVEWRRVHGDDLAARFAKLKGSERNKKSEKPVIAFEDEDSDEDELRKKEVERVMQWAADAARLDAFKGDDGDDANSGDEEEGDEKEEMERRREEKTKVKKGKPRKWFFF